MGVDGNPIDGPLFWVPVNSELIRGFVRRTFFQHTFERGNNTSCALRTTYSQFKPTFLQSEIPRTLKAKSLWIVWLSRRSWGTGEQPTEGWFM